MHREKPFLNKCMAELNKHTFEDSRNCTRLWNSVLQKIFRSLGLVRDLSRLIGNLRPLLACPRFHRSEGGHQLGVAREVDGPLDDWSMRPLHVEAGGGE